MIEIKSEIDFLKQNNSCTHIAKVAEDGAYAHFTIKRNPDTNCEEYIDCKVVVAPFSSYSGGSAAGWLFPKKVTIFTDL